MDGFHHSPEHNEADSHWQIAEQYPSSPGQQSSCVGKYSHQEHHALDQAETDISLVYQTKSIHREKKGCSGFNYHSGLVWHIMIET